MDRNRYSRQMLFAPIGEHGQKHLMDSTALVVGAGALGTVICNHLVRAGVGRIKIVDRDYVEFSNLQRQMLFEEKDAREAVPKAYAAKNKLEKINSEVKIEAHVMNITKHNIRELVQSVDIVMDGTDNFTTRYLLNDVCFQEGIPFSYGGVVGGRGMAALFIPHKTPCLRCLVKDGGEGGQTCDTVGVISPAVDIVSSLQVTEALKYLTNNHDQLRSTFLSFDSWFNRMYNIKFTTSDPTCPTCSLKKYPSLLDAVDEETVLCGRDTVQIHTRTAMDLQFWENKLAEVGSVQLTPFLLKVRIESIQFVIFPDGRVLVQGTEDAAIARSLYDRYIGS
ncbi:ThiF family adenylyltransferase [Virgibacillus sp. W0430]|uniref:ThiF family adenylyltransferase n=1 Tax=Virgibacillus sp. W0430 TaxID=3391580 RepID=UPI003F449BBF